MTSQRPVRIVPTNDLLAYLGNWKERMDIMYPFMARNNPEEAQRYYIAKIPTPIESFSFNSHDLSILLRYLDDKLGTLEQSQLTTYQFPYQSYAEARVFLKAFFVFFRILLDDLAGIIKYFYKKNEGIELPGKFNDLQKKAKKGELPAELHQLLKPTFLWFPKMKDTRDDLVHHFDSFLLSFRQGANQKNIVGHFNIKGGNSRIEKNTRKHIGILLSEYQRLIDNLFDHFDTKFKEWYGIIQDKSSRGTTIIIEDGIISLWWAEKYGDYKIEALQVVKDHGSSE